MLNVVATKPGIKFGTKSGQTSQSSSRNGPNWKTIVKAIVIVVAIAVAIYVGKTIIIPKVAEWIAKTKAAVEAAAVVVAKDAVKTHAASSFMTNAIWFTSGQSVSIGGAASSGVAAINNARTMLKPIQVLKVVFKAIGDELATESVVTPFAAAGGGGYAW